MPDHPQSLRGKTALITGGAKRLGRASALALAQAGAEVAITFRNSFREAQQTVADLSRLGVRAFALRCDITDEASVRSMMKDAGRELGHIDILVNNAANYETAEFEELTVQQWDAMFASNTRGPFLVSREALPWMRRPRARNKTLTPPELQQKRLKPQRRSPKSSTWGPSEACVRGPRTRTTVRRKPRCTCSPK